MNVYVNVSWKINDWCYNTYRIDIFQQQHVKTLSCECKQLMFSITDTFTHKLKINADILSSHHFSLQQFFAAHTFAFSIHYQQKQHSFRAPWNSHVFSRKPWWCQNADHLAFCEYALWSNKDLASGVRIKKKTFPAAPMTHSLLISRTFS